MKSVQNSNSLTRIQTKNKSRGIFYLPIFLGTSLFRGCLFNLFCWVSDWEVSVFNPVIHTCSPLASCFPFITPPISCYLLKGAISFLTSFFYVLEVFSASLLFQMKRFIFPTYFFFIFSQFFPKRVFRPSIFKNFTHYFIAFICRSR